MLGVLFAFGMFVGATVAQDLVRPTPQLCAQRLNQFDATFGNHGYMYSWAKSPGTTYNWIDGRNWCRQRCMDLVSIESAQENHFVKNAIASSGQRYAWTSGRLCNFNGCDQPHLLPRHLKGWFWAGSEATMNPTNDRFNTDWADISAVSSRQPDNMESPEACMAILHPNVYNDPSNQFRWHDIHCGHKKPIMCEDSDSLLSFARSQAPNLRI